MDGPTATKEIRMLGYRGPVIGLTGNAIQSDIDYFIQHGASAVIIKPASKALLLKTFQGIYFILHNLISASVIILVFQWKILI